MQRPGRSSFQRTNTTCSSLPRRPFAYGSTSEGNPSDSKYTFLTIKTGHENADDFPSKSIVCTDSLFAAIPPACSTNRSAWQLDWLLHSTGAGEPTRCTSYRTFRTSLQVTHKEHCDLAIEREELGQKKDNRNSR